MVEFRDFHALLKDTLGGEPSLQEERSRLLYDHYCLLVRWSKVINLAKIADWREAVRRHYAESLFLASRLPVGRLRILDVGSGAGFPGIPVAAARPESQVILAEARHRKAAFLREATRNWGNVGVHFGRAEGLSGGFDWVVARAVRPDKVAGVARALGGRIAWLGALADLPCCRSGAGLRSGVCWNAAIPLPWAADRGVIIGDVVG